MGSPGSPGGGNAERGSEGTHAAVRSPKSTLEEQCKVNYAQHVGRMRHLETAVRQKSNEEMRLRRDCAALRRDCAMQLRLIKQSLAKEEYEEEKELQELRRRHADELEDLERSHYLQLEQLRIAGGQEILGDP